MFSPVLHRAWRNGLLGELGLSGLRSPLAGAEDASGGLGTTIQDWGPVLP